MKARRLGLVVAALLAWCVAAHAQAPEDVVKIGVLTDHSGGFAYLAGKHSVEATQTAVDDFGGKVLGRPIVVVTADHQNKPDIAATLARKWFDTEGVDAITDVAGSAVALATQEIARAKMREMPVNDFYNKDVEIRVDGRVMHKTYLMKVKSPAESKYRGDYYQMLAEMSGNESFRPLSESQCSLVQNSSMSISNEV